MVTNRTEMICNDTKDCDDKGVQLDITTGKVFSAQDNGLDQTKKELNALEQF